MLALNYSSCKGIGNSIHITYSFYLRDRQVTQLLLYSILLGSTPLKVIVIQNEVSIIQFHDVNFILRFVVKISVC